ncbi:hypothetical protein ACWEPC_37800 [Nonomuraea sp. NPDC004297]
MFTNDPITWKAVWRLEKYWGDNTGPEAVPYDAIEREGNLLMHGGVSALWQMLGNGTTTAGQPLTYFNAANAHLSVGDSTTAAAATQTDLQAATNKLRKPMDATYPQHADGSTPTNATITFRATFGTADANWTWNEWGIFNASAGGRMLNRKVESLGTKTSAASWVLTCSLSIA